MIKQSNINHDARQALGISVVDYLVLDYLRQVLAAGIHDVQNAQIARDLGLSDTAVSRSVKECRDRNLLAAEDGRACVTETFYRAQVGQIEKPKTSVDEIIDLFNTMNGTRYNAKTYQNEIKTLMGQDPSLTLKHFQMVFDHKKATWGVDQKMKTYNAPSTILRRSNFFRYLDEARHYFMQNKPNV